MSEALPNQNHKVFFPGLNSLRFFAAMAVVLTHIEYGKKLLGYGEGLWTSPHDRISTTALNACLDGKMRWIAPITSILGEIGVVFFFVLSGFLITFLILKEKDTLGRVEIKKFYMRRILRIWPLYLFVVLLGFLVLPHLTAFQVYQQQRYLWIGYWQQFALFIGMLPNLAFAIYQVGVPNIGQAWSIGVEEQFYLIWPWILGKTRNIVRSIWIAMIVFLALKVGIMFVNESGNYSLGILKRFLISSKMECMVMGGLSAYYIYHQRAWFKDLVYNKWVQGLAYGGIIPTIYLLPIQLYPILHLIFAVQFLIIVVNVSTNPNSLFTFKNKALDYLGKVSYGIYMYHFMVVTVVIYAVAGHTPHFVRLTTIQNILVYLGTIFVTIGVSVLSYHFLEKPWMNRKLKYTTIISGDAANNATN